MNYPLVSVLVINWNGEATLKDCIDSIINSDYPNIEVVVLDNDSKDDSISILNKLCKKHKQITMRIIRGKKNVGFAKGNNIAYSHAKGAYILLLNNDAQIDKRMIQILVGHLTKNTNIAVVQPKITFRNSHTLQAGGTFMTTSGFLYHYGFGKDDREKKYNTTRCIFSANGSCMLIRREIIEKVGLFDEDFFCYFEESDFCWRVWLAGYTVDYCPSAQAYHKGRSKSDRFGSSLIQYHSYKNRIASILKNLGITRLLFVLSIHFVLCECISFVFLLNGRLDISRAIQKAIWWNISHLSEINKKRAYVQQTIRCVSDFEIAPYIWKNVPMKYYYYVFSGKLSKYSD